MLRNASSIKLNLEFPSKIFNDVVNQYGIKENYLISGILFNEKPLGAQSEEYARHELEMSEYLLRRGVPHCPVVGIVEIPTDLIENNPLDKPLYERVKEYYYNIFYRDYKKRDGEEIAKRVASELSSKIMEGTIKL